MKNSIIKFIKEYPITFICVIIFAILFSIQINILGLSYASIQNETNIISELLILTNSIMTGSFLTYKILSNYNEKIPKRIIDSQLLKNIAPIILIIILHFISRGLLILYGQKDNYSMQFILSLFFLSFTYLIIMTEKNLPLHEYMTKVFLNSLLLFLFECIVATGIGILFYIYYALFGSGEWEHILTVYSFVFSIISFIGNFIIIDNINTKPNLFSKILIKYVMMTIVFIGFVFFYIYLIKIVINKSLPSNQVFLVCTILFSAGLSTSLMAKTFDEKTPYDLAINYLPYAFIPALILQTISIFMRINQYGLTANRYFGITIIIFELIYIIFYIFKFNKLKYVLIAESILLFIVFYIPVINMFQLPTYYNTFIKRDAATSNSDTTLSTNYDNIINVNKFENTYQINVEGYKLMQDADIHIVYNEKENVWELYNVTSKKLIDFTEVYVIDNDSNIIDTLDITEHMDKIEESIISNNYSGDEEVIMKDIPNVIINDDKKYIISNTQVKYDKNLQIFTEIIFWGKLLTK